MSDISTSQDSAQRRAQPGVAAVSIGSPPFKVGDFAFLAVIGGPRIVCVLHIYPDGKDVCYLGEHGCVGYWPRSGLLDKAGYLAHCEYMRDDWTGKEYREAVARADRQFTLPEWWADAHKRAMEPFEENAADEARR